MLDKRHLGHLFCLASGVFLAALAPTVSAMTPEAAFGQWSRCDSSGFQAEVFKALNPGHQLPTDGKHGLLWPKLDYKNPEGRESVEYTQGPEIAGVPVLSYQNSNIDQGLLGRDYFWGFVVKGELEQVVARLKPLMYRPDRLFEEQKDLTPEHLFARTEVKFAPIDWTFFRTAFVPGTGMQHVERVLFFAASPIPGQVKVLCSLQGKVTPELLASERPDLPPLKYPHPLDPAVAEAMPLTGETAKAVARWADTAADWKPKFSKLHFSYLAIPDMYDVTIQPNGALLRIEETKRSSLAPNGTETHTITTSLAGLTDLKTHHDSGPLAQSVLRLDHLKVSWPTKLEQGASLHIEGQQVQSPNRTGNTHTVDTRCTVFDTMDASKIIGSLNGQAILLNCHTSDDDELVFAGFPTLGIFLPLERYDTKSRTLVSNPYSDLELFH